LASTATWGCRRAARLPLPADFNAQPHPEGLLFVFSLPSGAYATSLLREFVKRPGFSSSGHRDQIFGDEDERDAGAAAAAEEERRTASSAALPLPAPRRKATGSEDPRFPASRVVAAKSRRLEQWLLKQFNPEKGDASSRPSGAAAYDDITAADHKEAAKARVPDASSMLKHRRLWAMNGQIRSGFARRAEQAAGHE